MKYLVLILQCLLIGLASLGQPTITKMHNLAIGDKYSAKTADNEISTSLITLGANQVWDFSIIESNSPAVVASCIDPSSTPFADSLIVASSNIAIKSFGNEATDTITYQFLKVEGDNYEMLALGISAPNENLSFSKWLDPMVVLKMPFTYGDIFSDQYIMWMNHITENQYILKDTTNIQVAAIGYGTLKTPAGTFENALLVKKISQWKWWNNYGSFSFKTEGTDIDYQWFVPGIKIPVMNVMVMGDDPTGIAVYISDTEMTNGGLNDENGGTDGNDGNDGDGTEGNDNYYSSEIWLNVISAGGDIYTKNNGELSWTLGESIIETLDASSEVFTQGFWQVAELMTPIQNQEPINGEIKIYPNPFTSDLIIDIVDLQIDTKVAIYSAAGQIVRKFTINEPITRLHLNDCKSGVYYLRMMLNEGPKSFVIIKK